MAKLLIVLLIGLVFEAIGVVMLKKGINEMGEPQKISVAEVVRLLKAGVTSPAILGGVLFEALFFVCLLYLMSQADVSFVWPMTALSFVFTTLAARWVLHEPVVPMRWAGVVFIMIGAVLISWSEKAKVPAAESAQTVPSAAPGSAPR